MAINVISGYLNIKATEKTDWMAKLQTDPATKNLYPKVVHAFLLCNVKEPVATLRRTLDSIAAQNFPAGQIAVVLAMEERDPEGHDKAKKLICEYKNRFGTIISTHHLLAPGETIGKHSNEAYAAKIIKKLLVDQKKIPIENITLTTSDADSVFPHQYFSLLTYQFLTSKDNLNKFYQAPMFPFNNIDKVPLGIRIMELPSGISQISGLKKLSSRFFVVSTYTTSLWLLDKIGYWDLDYIPEDWHLNLKAYFETGGKVGIVPLYLVISIDAAESVTVWRTYQNRYQQVKRQAWGAVDVPYAIKQFFLHSEIPFWDKLNKLSFVLESHLLWSVNWFILTIGANLPTFLNPAFAQTALGFNLSKVSSFILTLCLFGLITIITVTVLLNPKHQKKWGQFLHPLTYLQWIFLPIAGFFLNALPGLEAQTRLMLGKYIEYQVTEKV